MFSAGFSPGMGLLLGVRPMTMTIRLLSFLLFAALAASAQTLSPTVAEYAALGVNQEVFLDHVRIIDGTGAAPLEDRTIVILQGKISHIFPPGSVTGGCAHCPPAKHVDLTGRTVFPGIVGMHDHLYYIARPNADAERPSRAAAGGAADDVFVAAAVPWRRRDDAAHDRVGGDRIPT